MTGGYATKDGSIVISDTAPHAPRIADAHRDDGKRFIVHADEKLTAFLQLESAIRGCPELS